MLKDVSGNVEWGYPDGEDLPLLRCICGCTWELWKGPVLGLDIADPTECPQCQRKFFWKLEAVVFELR